MLLISVSLLAVLSLVFFCALFWIKSNHGLQWVQSRINTEIPGRIIVESHQLSLLKPKFDLYGVVLHDSQGLALAGFTQFSVGLDWRALWRREIRLNRILLQGPWVDLAVDEVTGINLMNALVEPVNEKETEAPPADSAELPFNIVFSSIQLADGRFTYGQADDTMRLETTGFNLSASGNLKNQSFSLELALDSVRFSSADIHPETARILLRADLNGDKLSVPVFSVTSGQTTLNLSGSADDLYGKPVIDSILSVDSQLTELMAILNLADDYAGSVNANLTLKGTVANPDAKLVLSVGSGLLAGQPVDRGDLAIGLKDREATIDMASLQLAEGSVILSGTVNLREAFPTGFLEPPADVNAIDYALTLAHEIPDLNSWLKPFVDIKGASTGRVSLTGKGVMPADILAQLTLQASGQKLLAPGMDRSIDADVKLSAQMDGGTISISRLKALADDVELSGDGRFQMDDEALAAKLSLRADDLSKVLAVAGIPSVNGACTAELAVDGSLKQPQFSLDLVSKNLKIETYSLGDLIVQANMDPEGRLNLNSFDLQNRGSRIEGKAQLRLLPGGGGIDPEFVNTLALTLETLSAGDFMESPPVNGTIDGRLQVGGPLGSLTGELFLIGKALGTDVASIGDVDAHMRLNAGTVFMDRLNLRNKASIFNATGSIQLLTPETLRLVEDPSLNFTVNSDHLDPGDFIDKASGDFTFIGEIKGSLDKPIGKITLAGRQINLAGQSLETLSLDARFNDRRLWLDQVLAVFIPGEQIEGGGSVGMDKTIDLQLKSDGISLSSIQRLNDFLPGEGQLRLDATGKGNIENPDIDGHLSISDIIINDEAMENINLTFSLHDMLAKVKGNLDFDMDATCDLKKGDFDARLIFDRTETAAYFKAAGKPDFRGTLTGQVQAVGNINDVDHASGQVDLNALELFYKDISLIQSDKMKLKMVDQQLSIPEFEVVLLSSGSLRLKGDARIGGQLNMKVDGRIPLAAAGVFSDEVADAKGVLIVEGGLTGNTAAPQIDARVDLENIGMTVPGLVQKLHDLNGSIQLTSDNIKIEALSGFLDTGSFSLNGNIAHEKFTPAKVNLAIKAKALPLEVADTMSVLLNSDIQITGNDRTAAARGEIVLLEGVYYKDVKINLLQIATSRQRSVAPETTPLSLPYFDTVNLDIAIKNRQPFFVQNNLAQLEISPDLKIEGALARPIVSGRAQVKSGTVIFQKKIFDVKKGIIDFINPYKTEAEIDIESETTIRTWTITLTIKGTPDNLDLRLSSVPTESDSDILSLILFGRTAQELAGGEGGQKRSTGQIMAEMIADTFGEDIKKTTGVDILQLETSDTSDDQDAAGVKVTVGKHLSDRMTVKYAVESKDGVVVQRAITEYKLLENILVSGFQDNLGIFGAELVFRIEFR